MIDIKGADDDMMRVVVVGMYRVAAGAMHAAIEWNMGAWDGIDGPGRDDRHA